MRRVRASAGQACPGYLRLSARQRRRGRTHSPAASLHPIPPPPLCSAITQLYSKNNGEQNDETEHDTTRQQNARGSCVRRDGGCQQIKQNDMQPPQRHAARSHARAVRQQRRPCQQADNQFVNLRIADRGNILLCARGLRQTRKVSTAAAPYHHPRTSHVSSSRTSGTDPPFVWLAKLMSDITMETAASCSGADVLDDSYGNREKRKRQSIITNTARGPQDTIQPTYDVLRRIQKHWNERVCAQQPDRKDHARVEEDLTMHVLMRCKQALPRTSPQSATQNAQKKT